MKMQYKAGDRVCICSEWNGEAARLVNPDGKMDHWLGAVMTIREVNDRYGHYLMQEDKDERGGYGWFWYDSLIEGLADETLPTNVDDGFLSLLY